MAACIWWKHWTTSPTCKSENAEKLAYVTQTTLSVDDAAAVVNALKQKYPAIVGPKRRYLLRNAKPQDAVKSSVIRRGSGNRRRLAEQLQPNRLREVAENLGRKSYMVDNADQLQQTWFDGARHVASPRAPRPRMYWCGRSFPASSRSAQKQWKSCRAWENVVFSLPKGLNGNAAQAQTNSQFQPAVFIRIGWLSQHEIHHQRHYQQAQQIADQYDRRDLVRLLAESLGNQEIQHCGRQGGKQPQQILLLMRQGLQPQNSVAISIPDAGHNTPQ